MRLVVVEWSLCALLFVCLAASASSEETADTASKETADAASKGKETADAASKDKETADAAEDEGVFLRMPGGEFVDADSNVASEEGRTRRPYRRILVFGGNGMQGTPTVRRLVQDLWADVTIVNRGNWYWDTEEVVKPAVKHIKCDRGLPVRSCRGLMKELQHWMYHVVIDFSAYDPQPIQSLVSVIKNNTDLYVYVSTDSVYEVSAPRQGGAGPSEEADAVRPEAVAERERLSKLDAYGDGKLKAEEVLVAQRKLSPSATDADGKPVPGFPYVIFRNADVVGPRDNTMRFWHYLLWLVLHHHGLTKMAPPLAHTRDPMSLTYSEDVAGAILYAIQHQDQVRDQVFNFGFEETVTLADLLAVMQTELNIKDAGKSTRNIDEDIPVMYPTVKRGPMNTEKFKRVFKGFSRTPFRKAISDTVAWYQKAAVKYRKELEAQVDLLAEQLEFDKHDALNFLYKLYPEEEEKTGLKDEL